MADEDEIDILGDFSFNSCLAQNDQGIPTCSSREDTVHPEWLLDSTSNNWYDRLENSSLASPMVGRQHSSWSKIERELLIQEMDKYGRDPKRIAKILKTKTEAEIQALIDAEYGINLDTATSGLDISEIDGIPMVVQEEIIANEEESSIKSVINLVTTAKPTITIKQKVFNRLNKGKSLLKPNVLEIDSNKMINADDIYEQNIVLGSDDLRNKDKLEVKNNTKVVEKMGNHRRKYDKLNIVRNRRSPVDRQRKSSSSSDAKSPKLQIVLGSGQALPVSEGEQVIIIEKKMGTDSESDIEIDIDSGDESVGCNKIVENNNKLPISKVNKDDALFARKFEPMPRRKRKFNLEGGGGCTIMHTDAGDLYEISSEPRKERNTQRKQHISLLPCRLYSAEKPAPYSVCVNISSLISMELQTHSSRDEVMGLCGGQLSEYGVLVNGYWPAAANAGATHCDMCPVSQSAAAERLLRDGCRVVGWHHSHPSFLANPSAMDLSTQRALQEALETPGAPFLGIITSQFWGNGRTASHYKCIRVEVDPDGTEVGYQLNIKPVPDLTLDNLPAFIQRLSEILDYCKRNSLVKIDITRDICPQAQITYLDKCLSSIKHHLHSAGYEDDHELPQQLLSNIRDIFR